MKLRENTPFLLMNEITSSEDVRLTLLSIFQTRSMRTPATNLKSDF